MPRDPQGAGTRKFSTDWMLGRADTGCAKCDWTGRIPVPCPDNKAGCIVAHYRRCACSLPTTTITRYPIPPHAGEETKG